MGNKTWLVIFLLSLGTLLIYFQTSPGATAYNHFVLLADAFLKGHFYVEGVYPWIEKAPLNDLQFFIVNPPMPAILLMPLVAIWGLSFPQHIFAHFMGVGLVIATFYMSLKIKRDLKLAIWSAFLIGFGSIIWFLSTVGSVWYLGQLTCALFLTFAVNEVLGRKRPFLLGLLLGATYLSRIHLALTFPIFALILWQDKKSFTKLLKFSIPILIFIALDFFYNFSRYGTIFNRGYFLIPGTENEPWFAKGIMHPSYILEDLKIAFLKMPLILNEFPYLKPSWAGMAIWLTTPAFIFSLWAGFKNKIVKLFWLAIALVFIVVGAHGGTGFAQFGYRFAVDFYPFLTYLTISGVKNLKGPKNYHWVLLAIGFLVNLWGVISINKFGFVGW